MVQDGVWLGVRLLRTACRQLRVQALAVPPLLTLLLLFVVLCFFRWGYAVALVQQCRALPLFVSAQGIRAEQIYMNRVFTPVVRCMLSRPPMTIYTLHLALAN